MAMKHLLVFSLIFSVAALLGLIVISQPSHKSVALRDADDDAFFDGSRELARQGDQDMKRSGQAMDSGDVELAMSLSKDAARAYHKALADRRYRRAKAVQKELQEALKAKETEKIESMDNMLEKAEKIRDAAVRRANALKQHTSPANILRTSGREHATIKGDDKLSAQIKLLMKNQKLIRIKPTQLDEDQSGTSQPVPKVLDCGPLSNDCNLQQGGEYYIHNNKPKNAQPDQSHEPLQAKAGRASMLSGTDRRPDGILGFKLLKHVGSADRKLQREALLSPKTSQESSDQLLRSLATGFLTPRAHSSANGVRVLRGQELAQGSNKLSVLAQMNDLDVEQAKLNKQRDELIRSYLGSAKDHTILASLVMQWVPKGMLAIPSSLTFTPIKRSETADVKAEDAKKIRIGGSGQSLDEALADVNKRQVAINKNRLVLMQQIHTSNPNHLIEEAAKAGEEVPALVQLSSTPEGKEKELRKKLFKSHFDEATKAFEAASSAFKVADAQGRSVVKTAEGKKTEAVAPVHAAAAAAAAAAAPLKARHPAVSHPSPQQPKQAQAEEKKPEEAHPAEKAATSVKQSPAAGSSSERKKEGLVRYDAVKAAQDLTGFFDDLITKRIAVGAGPKPLQAQKTHKHELSELERERKKEEDLIAKQEQEDISVQRLEQARKYVIKSGQPAAYVGNELRHKSAEESRKELNDFYDSLSH